MKRRRESRARPLAEEGGRRAARVAGVVAVTALALCTRLYRLGYEPLWFDEAYGVMTAISPLAHVARSIPDSGNAPLYYFLLHGWIRIFGDGEFQVRLLSALAGTAAVPLLYRVGSALFSPRAGLIAALLAVASPLHVHYSQEARMYPLVVLLSLGMIWALHGLTTRPVLGRAVVLGVCFAAGLYLQYFFLFLLPITLVVVWAKERKRAVMLTGGALIFAGACFVPWLPYFLDQAEHSAPFWVAEFWQRRSLAYAVPWSLEVLGPAAIFPTWSSFKLGNSQAGRFASLMLAACVVGGATWLVAKRDESSRSLALVLAALLVPLLAALLLSVLQRPIYVVARYEMISWGAYHLLAGAILARLKPVALAAGAVGLWLVLSAHTLYPYFTKDRPRRNYADLGKQIAASIQQRVDPKETVIFTAGTWMMTSYYLRNVTPRPRLVAYPLEANDHPGWVNPKIRTDPGFAAAEAERFANWLLDVPSPPPVVWIVAPRTRGTGPLVSELVRRGYRVGPTNAADLFLRLSANQGQPTQGSGRAQHP